jgi:hypothetical protein
MPQFQIRPAGKTPDARQAEQPQLPKNTAADACDARKQANRLDNFG